MTGNKAFEKSLVQAVKENDDSGYPAQNENLGHNFPQHFIKNDNHGGSDQTILAFKNPGYPVQVASENDEHENNPVDFDSKSEVFACSHKTVSTNENLGVPYQVSDEKENLEDNFEPQIMLTEDGLRYPVEVTSDNENFENNAVQAATKQDPYPVQVAPENEVHVNNPVKAALKSEDRGCLGQTFLKSKDLGETPVPAISEDEDIRNNSVQVVLQNQNFDQSVQIVPEKGGSGNSFQSISKNEVHEDNIFQAVLERQGLGHPVQVVSENENHGNNHVNAALSSENLGCLDQTISESLNPGENLAHENFESNPVQVSLVNRDQSEPAQTVLKNEDFEHHRAQIVLEDEVHGGDPVQGASKNVDHGFADQAVSKNVDHGCADQAVNTAERERPEKNERRSREPFTSNPTITVSSFDRILTVIMAFIIFKGAYANITDSPENLAVPENAIAVFKCKTNTITKPLLWTASIHASPPVSIFDGERVNPAYQEFCSVSPNAGRYDLHVKATPEMAFKFMCSEPGSVNIERTAELIILESPSTCEVTFSVHDNAAMDTKFTDLVCTINTLGNWIPSLKWRFNETQVPLTFTNLTERFDGQRVKVTSTLHNVPLKDKQKYMCDAFFALEPYKGDATSRHVPTYNCTCMAPQAVAMSAADHNRCLYPAIVTLLILAVGMFP